MKRVLKRSTKRYIIVTILVLILMGLVGFGVYAVVHKQLKTEYDEKLHLSEEALNEQVRYGLVAIEDISAGDLLTNENVSYIEFYSSQPQELFLTNDDLGKIVLVNISANTQITKSMITNQQVNKGLREVQYSEIRLSANIKNNDYVDVRIGYPNGENYVVLSKKQIKNFTENSPDCFLWQQEEEIERMSAAIVDCYLYTDSYLYVTKYIEPNIQDASIVTYVPTLQTIAQIKSDPNILKIASDYLSEKVRMQLENRLVEYQQLDINEKWSEKVIQSQPDIVENSEKVIQGQPDIVENDAINQTTETDGDDYFGTNKGE